MSGTGALDPGTRSLSLTVICVGSALAPLLVHSSTLGIPAIARELALDARTLSWFPLATVIGNAMFQFPAARLGDRFGRKRLFALGLLIAALASGLAAMSATGWAIIACRFFQGIGNAIIFATGVALVADIAPESQRTRALGIYMAACYLGITGGPLFGGVVIEHLGWRAVFYLPVPLLVLTSAICFLVLRWEAHGDRERRLDFTGVLIYGIAIACIAPALQDITGRWNAIALGAGLLFLAVFSIDQYRKPHALVDVRLLIHNARFGLACLTVFFVNASTFSIPFVMTLYLQFVRALSPQDTGLVLMLQAILTSVVSPLAGRLCEYFAEHTIAYAGLACVGAGLAVFAALAGSTPIVLVPLALILVGGGLGLFEPLAMNFTLSAIGIEHRGGAAALVNSTRVLGSFVSLGLISAYLSLAVGPVVISAAVRDGLSTSVQWYFLGALVTIALAAFTVARIRATVRTAE